ncbi:Hydroperoxide isomerase ALOXE3 [Liparis tanakae]|uniref:Hydroperoxide isomerase ALOXE3 n=1 Tax=Liparis tanakae TaxID=230148 RepID=A0A4Z2IET5_9TELE|nr:Hydroperoxide isomerase ALOXE3 [Liparis tanakae]
MLKVIRCPVLTSCLTSCLTAMASCHEFEVTVHTSPGPTCGTFSRLWLNLIGSQGETPPISVCEGDHHLLPGSARPVRLRADGPLGRLLLVRLRLEARTGFPDLDWHCSRVEVRELAGGREAGPGVTGAGPEGEPQVQEFLCDRWLRPAEGDVELRSGKCENSSSSSIPDANLHYLKGFAGRADPWAGFAELEEVFAHIGHQNRTAGFVKAHWKEDWYFGYQCLNGCNPLMLHRTRLLPPNLSVTSDMLRPFLSGGSSLEQELENPVFLPSDAGCDWLLAKIWVRCADFQCHQLVSHYLRTHMLGELCCVATLRQLPEPHPLHQLLMPHVRTSLQINLQARMTLLAANGVFDKASGSGLEAIPVLLSRASDRICYASLCVPEDLKQRGVDTLPQSHYAQDALRVWGALHRFVLCWVDLYYRGDDEVLQDSELQHWISDINAHSFRHSSGFPPTFRTKAEVSTFVTMIIFSCSALHAAVNFSQLDFSLWMPNAPASMRRPPPRVKSSPTEDDVVSFLPDVNSTCRIQMALTLLSQPALDFVPLCHYKEAVFRDPAHCGLVEAVQADLAAISDDITQRNSQLELPYLYLSPGGVENSVAI